MNEGMKEAIQAVDPEDWKAAAQKIADDIDQRIVEDLLKELKTRVVSGGCPICSEKDYPHLHSAADIAKRKREAELEKPKFIQLMPFDSGLRSDANLILALDSAGDVWKYMSVAGWMKLNMTKLRD